MILSCLAPQTWSVLDFFRRDLRTLRLAIAVGKTARLGATTVGWARMASARQRPCYASQVASGDHLPSRVNKRASGRDRFSRVECGQSERKGGESWQQCPAS